MIYAIDDNKIHRKVNIADADRLDDMGHKIVQANADGWIEWNGGECPLPDDQPIEYKMRGRDGVHQAWPYLCYWGNHGLKMDIIAYRPIIDQPASEEPKEWRGPEDGLPPVGAEVEYRAGCAEVPSEYSRCTIIAHFTGESGDQLAAFTYKSHDGDIQLGRGSPRRFRPLRTDREQWLEAARKAIVGPLNGRTGLEILYDALASGELPTPEKTK